MNEKIDLMHETGRPFAPLLKDEREQQLAEFEVKLERFTDGSEPTIRSLVDISYLNAVVRGFHPEVGDASFGDRIALCHAELSESLEAYRDRKGPFYREEDGKPEGTCVELADVVIRIADLCGTYGWDLADAIVQKMAYNATRPFRHGNKVI